MNIEVWENSIITRLTPEDAILPQGVLVKAMPETQEEYERTFEDARITVSFNAANWRATKATDLVVQTADVDFTIIIQSRHLRGETGVYALFDKVKKYLVGFEPTGCKKLRSKDFTLYSNEKDLFTFIYVMTCEFDAAQWFNDQDPDAVLIKRIQADEEIGATENSAVIVVETPPIEEI